MPQKPVGSCWNKQRTKGFCACLILLQSAHLIDVALRRVSMLMNPWNLTFKLWFGPLQTHFEENVIKQILKLLKLFSLFYFIMFSCFFSPCFLFSMFEDLFVNFIIFFTDPISVWRIRKLPQEQNITAYPSYISYFLKMKHSVRFDRIFMVKFGVKERVTFVIVQRF